MLEPKDWGWKENGTTLSPILSDDVVAPEKLLKYIYMSWRELLKHQQGN